MKKILGKSCEQSCSLAALLNALQVITSSRCVFVCERAPLTQFKMSDVCGHQTLLFLHVFYCELQSSDASNEQHKPNVSLTCNRFQA